MKTTSRAEWVRQLHYEDGFTLVTGTIPSRALEVFAPFLAVQAADSVDQAGGGGVRGQRLRRENGEKDVGRLTSDIRPRARARAAHGRRPASLSQYRHPFWNRRKR